MYSVQFSDLITSLENKTKYQLSVQNTDDSHIKKSNRKPRCIDLVSPLQDTTPGKRDTMRYTG